MLNPRGQFLSELGDLSRLRGLEIGALDNPLVERLKGGNNIFYLDHLSTGDLKKKYETDSSVQKEKIVSVDFVCPNGDLLDAVGDQKFDYIILSHVIEHSPNLLKLLADLSDILEPGGFLFLVVPDKRFTFDFYRPVTTFGMLLENYLGNKVAPSISSVYDHFSTAIWLDPNEVWTGAFDFQSSKPLSSLSNAWEAANLVSKEEAYIDVHINIFTPQSFFKIFEQVIQHEIVELEVKKYKDTGIGQLEFMLVLSKPFKPLQDGLQKQKCLDSIPKFEMEAVLSPYMPQVKLLSESLAKITEVTQNLQKEIELLRAADERNKSDKQTLETSVKNLQKVLDRRSVRLALIVADKIFSLLKWKSFNR